MPRHLSKSRLLAYSALLGNTFLWGIALPIVKKGFDHGLTPNTFLFSRLLIALLTSLPLLYFFRRQKSFKQAFTPRNLVKIIVLELLGTVFSLILLYEGLRLTTAVESSLIAMTIPIFVILGGVFFFKEREEKREWLGLIIALIGTFLLIIKPLLNLGINGNTFGNLLVFSQNILVATYYLLAKYQYKGLNKWAVTHLSFWVGTIGFAIIIAIQGISPVSSFLSLLDFSNPWPLIAVLYMAIPGSVIALTLYLIGQDKIEASEASLFTYLNPLFSLPASILLLGERVSSLEIIATLVILYGVYLAEKR